VTLHVNVGSWTDERMRRLKDVLVRHPGETPLNICLLYPDNAKVYLRASKDLKVRMSEALAKECGKIVDGLYVATVTAAGLTAPPEKRTRRWNGG